MRQRTIFIDYLFPHHRYNTSLSREGWFVLHPMLHYLATLKRTLFLKLSDAEWTDDPELALSFTSKKEALKIAKLWKGATIVTNPSSPKVEAKKPKAPSMSLEPIL